MNFLKNIILVMCLSLIPIVGSAQGQSSIQKGNVLINPSITLGWYNYGYNYDLVNLIPPVAVNFEYAVNDFISVGVEGEYGLRNYKDFNFIASSYSYKYEYKGISLRGSFHYLDFLKTFFEDDLGSFNSDKIDFYVGASLGVLVTSYKSTWTTPSDGRDHEQKYFDSSMRFGYMAGFRYYFSNNFGAFFESGKNSLGWVKVGLTFKF